AHLRPPTIYILHHALPHSPGGRAARGAGRNGGASRGGPSRGPPRDHHPPGIHRLPRPPHRDRHRPERPRVRRVPFGGGPGGHGGIGRARVCTPVTWGGRVP